MTSRDRAAAVLVVLTVCFAALAVGSTTRWTACGAAGLSLLTVVPYLGSRRRIEAVGPLFLLLGAAAIFTLFQLVPLPWALVEVLSPAKAELVAANASALREPLPSFTSISYDWPATLMELARLLGYLGVAYSASRVACSSRGRLWLAYGLCGTGAAVVLVMALHAAVGADRLYGLYQPSFTVSTPLAPFLNPNHLAGFLALLAPVSLGVAIHSAGPRRFAWAAITVVLASGSLLAPSRAGAAALIVGIACTAILTRARRSKRTYQRTTVISIGIVLGCIVVLVATVAGQDAWNELLGTSSDELMARQGKLAAWRAAMPLVGEHWMTGVGRGGFETAFTSIHGSHGEVFSRIENEYLQAMLDWGIPVGALLGALFVLAARRAAGRWADGAIEAGLLGGLVAIGLHNTLDFSLAFAGVATPAVIMLAILVRPRVQLAEGKHLRWKRLTVTVAALAVVALASSSLGRTVREDADDLSRTAADDKKGLELAQAAWLRHPADHLAAGYTARALLARGDSRAGPVLARALAFHPRHPDLHRLAARLLYSSPQPMQALVEYRLALRYAWTSADSDSVLEELIKRFPDPEIAVRGLPEDPDLMARLIPRLIGMKRQELALTYARRVAEFYPNLVLPWHQVTSLASSAGDDALALHAAKQAIHLAPDAESAIAMARVLVRSSRPAEAEQVLEKALQEGYPTSAKATDVELLIALSEAQLASERPEQARATLLRALGLAANNRNGLAKVHAQMAVLEAGEGNEHKARWHREQSRQALSK